MKQLTVILDPGDRRLISVFDQLDSEKVKREYLHHYNLLSDGTVVLLYQLRGELEYARNVFEESADVIHYDIPEQSDGLVYLHCEITTSLEALLTAVQESEVIMAMPVEFLRDDRLRLTFIGEHDSLHRILALTAERIDVEIERLTEYGSEDQFSSLLTDRQREILTIAVEQGYYEVPRQATIRTIADEIELSQATVGEHLQKIEARVLSDMVR